METAIKINNITKSYKDKVVFRDLNLLIYRNSTVEMLGLNGCGKSTLIGIIAGIVKPDSGNVEVFETKNHLFYNQRIGYTFSFDYFYSQYTIKKNVEIISIITSTPIINYNNLLNEFDLNSYYNKKINTLSAGMKQRLKLVFCLAKNPGIIILDEPTVHLDNKSIDTLIGKLQLFKNIGSTILFTTHNPEHLKSIVDTSISIGQAE